jgi:DNA polymerase-3 subunit delta'
MDQLARRWVEGDVDRAEALAIADKFRGAEGQERFETLMDRLIAAVRMRALSSPAGAGNRWAELWERLQPLPERAAGLNLDKADVLAGALADLRRVQAQQARMG